MSLTNWQIASFRCGIAAIVVWAPDPKLEVRGGVPDAGSSLLLLGMGLAGLRAWTKRLE